MSASALVLGAVLSVGSSSDAKVIVEVVLDRPDVLRLTIGEQRYEHVESRAVHRWRLKAPQGGERWVMDLGSGQMVLYEGQIADENDSIQNVGLFVQAPTGLGPSQRTFAALMRHNPDRVILETDSRWMTFRPLLPSSGAFDWERWFASRAATLSHEPHWGFGEASLDLKMRLVSGNHAQCLDAIEAKEPVKLGSGKPRLCVLGLDGSPIVSIERGGEGDYARSSVGTTHVVRMGGGDPGLSPPTLISRSTKWSQEYHFTRLHRAADGWWFEARGMEGAPIDAFRLGQVTESSAVASGTRGVWLTAAGLQWLVAFVLFLLWTVRGTVRRSPQGPSIS